MSGRGRASAVAAETSSDDRPTMEDDARRCAKIIYEDICRGRRHWTIRDLFDLIGRFGLELLPVDDMPRGYGGWYSDGAIAIDARLSGRDYVLVIPHELGHHLLETERYSDLNHCIDGRTYDARGFSERVCTLLGGLFAERGRMMDERDRLTQEVCATREALGRRADLLLRLCGAIRTSPERVFIGESAGPRPSSNVFEQDDISPLVSLGAELDTLRRRLDRLDAIDLELST